VDHAARCQLFAATPNILDAILDSISVNVQADGSFYVEAPDHSGGSGKKRQTYSFIQLVGDSAQDPGSSSGYNVTPTTDTASSSDTNANTINGNNPSQTQRGAASSLVASFALALFTLLAMY